MQIRKEQMITIFDLLKTKEHAIFTADFNFDEDGEEGIFPSEYIDVWPVGLILFHNHIMYSNV